MSIGRVGDRDLGANSADPAAVEEAALVRRVRRGDSRAFEALVRSHWHRVFRYAQVILRDTEMASDVAQETLLRLWQARATLNPAFPPSTWLLRTARNLAISEKRKRWVRLRWLKQHRGERERAPSDPLRELEQQEAAAVLRKGLDRLSNRRREVFELYHLQKLSYREIALVMGIRQQTVANYLRAAMQDLRRFLHSAFPALLPPE